MVRHIVMWKFREDKKDEIPKFHKMLLELKNKLPIIKYLEVGTNCYNIDKNFEMVLITEFENSMDLEEYATHPIHMEVVNFAKEIVDERATVDYDLEKKL